jgi:hypothetical protein
MGPPTGYKVLAGAAPEGGYYLSKVMVFAG